MSNKRPKALASQKHGSARKTSGQDTTTNTGLQNLQRDNCAPSELNQRDSGSHTHRAESSVQPLSHQPRVPPHNDDSVLQRPFATSQAYVSESALWQQNQTLPCPTASPMQRLSNRINPYAFPPVGYPNFLPPTNPDTVEARSIETIDCFTHDGSIGESSSRRIHEGERKKSARTSPVKEIAFEKVKDAPLLVGVRPPYIPHYLRDSHHRATPQQQMEVQHDQGLGANFVPGPWDVICGRGKRSYDHIGNRRLRLLIATKLERYVGSKRRGDKTAILTEIVQQIESASPYGGFVRKVQPTKQERHDGKEPPQSHARPEHQPQVWSRLGPTAARDRVGHAIRDCLPPALRLRPSSRMDNDNDNNENNDNASDRLRLLRTAEQAMVQSSIVPLHYHHGY